jgi:hypothetical protein
VVQGQDRDFRLFGSRNDGIRGRIAMPGVEDTSAYVALALCRALAAARPVLGADTGADLRVARNAVHNCVETPSYIDLPCRSLT